MIFFLKCTFPLAWLDSVNPILTAISTLNKLKTSQSLSIIVNEILGMFNNKIIS